MFWTAIRCKCGIRAVLFAVAIFVSPLCIAHSLKDCLELLRSQQTKMLRSPIDAEALAAIRRIQRVGTDLEKYNLELILDSYNNGTVIQIPTLSERTDIGLVTSIRQSKSNTWRLEFTLSTLHGEQTDTLHGALLRPFREQETLQKAQSNAEQSSPGQRACFADLANAMSNDQTVQVFVGHGVHYTGKILLFRNYYDRFVHFDLVNEKDGRVHTLALSSVLSVRKIDQGMTAD